MGRKVAVMGRGCTKFRSRWLEKTYFELAVDAVKEAIADAGITKDDIECAVYGIYNELFERQVMPDVYVHDYLGLRLKPSTRVTAGGATGGAAIRSAYLEVASGQADIALVVGTERATECYNYDIGNPTPETLKAISYSVDMTWEYPLGATAAASFAVPLITHMKKYGTPTEEQMAKVSVKNHRNAKLNPLAQSPKDITVEDVLKSRMICYPYKLYDNCLYSEGAAALILASEDVVKKFKTRPIWITGVGASTDTGMAGCRPDIHLFESTRLASQRSYEMAGIKNPIKDLDLAELHDAFTGTEIMSYEDCGFCKIGDGGKLIDEGIVEPDGELPVNMSGGLIGCGHAVGATGLMQMGELVFQLRGEAGKRQVDGAKRGLVQSIGGPGCAWTYSFIMERGQAKWQQIKMLGQIFFQKKIAVDEQKLEKAFKGELETQHSPDDPLEVPDKMSITYKYTYGGQSRFFRELRDNKKIMGTKCKSCGLTFCPPRSTCSNCYGDVQWTELTGQGTVEGCTVVHFGTSEHVGKVPFVCAFIKLDGADFFIWHMIETDDVNSIKPGTRVKASFKDKRFGLISDFIFKPVQAQPKFGDFLRVP